MERGMEILGRVAHARRRTVAVNQNARRYENFPIPGHQSQRSANRLPRRKVGHGRLWQTIRTPLTLMTRYGEVFVSSNRLPRRKLGHGRLAQTRLPRAP